MKSKWMLRVCLTVGMLAVVTVVSASAWDWHGKCETLSGTIGIVAGDQGWAGPAYLSFGKDPTVYTAYLLDVNNGYKDNPDFTGDFAGYEILTFTIKDVGSFRANAEFLALMGETPYYYKFYETGKITGGDGAFAHASGLISIRGLFVTGGGIFGTWDPVNTPWVWISEMHGSICGIKK